MGMGTREWNGMGMKILFPHIPAHLCCKLSLEGLIFHCAGSTVSTLNTESKIEESIQLSSSNRTESSFPEPEQFQQQVIDS